MALHYIYVETSRAFPSSQGVCKYLFCLISYQPIYPRFVLIGCYFISICVSHHQLDTDQKKSLLKSKFFRLIFITLNAIIILNRKNQVIICCSSASEASFQWVLQHTFLHVKNMNCVNKDICQINTCISIFKLMLQNIFKELVSIYGVLETTYIMRKSFLFLKTVIQIIQSDLVNIVK